MNHLLDTLSPYPFERLRGLLKGITPDPAYSPISMSIGEPKHPAPAIARQAMVDALDGLSNYPPTLGGEPIRRAMAQWLQWRYQLPSIDPARQIIPVNGSKEALYAIAQLVVDVQPGQPRPIVLIPNPCYQVYEGAALLAGAEPVYVNQTAENGFAPDWDSISESEWARVQLVYICSPGNPSGTVLDRSQWARLFERSARHGFVIASDECYSEIYPDEAHPPEGALQAAHALGLTDFDRLIVFSSLSKRSSLPGLRSGFAAGDARLIERFLLLRTYNGGAMSQTVQAASVAAWRDEAHVTENRALYRAKFDAVVPLLAPVLKVEPPQGGFFLWAGVPDGDDTTFARDLYAQYNVLLLPGSFLARSIHGVNPGAGMLRIALVDSLDACLEAARRIRLFAAARTPGTPA